MFSEAISSISSRWRPSSLPIASAISGSDSASEAEKKVSRSAAAFGLRDIHALLGPRCNGAERGNGLLDAAEGVAYRPYSAKAWDGRLQGAQHIGAVVPRHLLRTPPPGGRSASTASREGRSRSEPFSPPRPPTR